MVAVAVYGADAPETTMPVIEAVLPRDQTYLPTHWLAVQVADDAVITVPAVIYMVVEETVWFTLTVHEEPLPAVITVPAATPVPVTSWPIATVPDVTVPMVNVTPEMLDVPT